MTEPQKKGKGGLIALGVLVVILAISSVVLFIQMNTLQSQWNSLNTTYQNYVSTHSHSDTEYNALKDTVDLKKSTILVDHQTVSQPANSYVSWTFHAQYAGYIIVHVESSTTDKTYVRVDGSSDSLKFDGTTYGNILFGGTTNLGTSGYARFAVLPSTLNDIEVRVGNTNLVNGATETVTVIYYY